MSSVWFSLVRSSDLMESLEIFYKAIVNWLSTLPLQIQVHRFFYSNFFIPVCVPDLFFELNQDQDPVLLRQLRRAHARNTAY